MFQNILFPTDGSNASMQAAEAVFRLATSQGELHVTVAVVISPLAPDQSDYKTEYLDKHNAWLRKEAQLVADRVAQQLRVPGVSCTTKILEGRPVSAVLAKEVANGKYQLLVMSSRGLGYEQDTLHYLGNVTEHLIRRISIPILVVPVQNEDEEED